MSVGCGVGGSVESEVGGFVRGFGDLGLVCRVKTEGKQRDSSGVVL